MPTTLKDQESSHLAKLPLSAVLRSLVILSISSSPLLLAPSVYILSALANPHSAITDVARNPVLNWLVKHSLYRQFNAGENKAEVQQTIHEIKRLGHSGVLLGYAREGRMTEDDESGASRHTNGAIHDVDEKITQDEVDTWLRGTLQTVDMATPGDFVALK
jgi:hypothetical protein